MRFKLTTLTPIHMGNDEIMDEFINVIRNQAGSNMRDKHKLIDLFEKYVLSNRPFISGTSIKGAIQTALIYDYLSNDTRKLTGVNK